MENEQSVLPPSEVPEQSVFPPPRPVYETPDDEKREAVIRQAVSHRWGLRNIPRPKLWAWDCDLYSDDRLVALLEVKRRFNIRAAYPDLIISKAKIDNTHAAAEAMGIHWLLGIHWNDGIWLWSSKTHGHSVAHWEVSWEGREDRNDQQDKEWCYKIPVEQFRPLVPDPRAVGNRDDPDAVRSEE